MSGNVPNVRPDEDCKQIVTDMLKDKIRLNEDKSQISVSHRVGSKPKRQGPDNRKILFKLVQRDLNSDILSACRQFKPDVYINESLTPTRDKVYYVLRKVAKKFPLVIHYCKTLEGNVTVFLQSGRVTRTERNNNQRLPKQVINTRKQLDEFLMKKLSTTLEELDIE